MKQVVFSLALDHLESGVPSPASLLFPFLEVRNIKKAACHVTDKTQSVNLFVLKITEKKLQKR